MYFDRFGSLDFTQEAVNNFLNNYKNGVAKAFASNLKEFFIEQHPSVFEYQKIRIPKTRGRKNRKLPDFPTEEELYKIESACLNEREKIMLLLSFYSALRPQGLLTLNLRAFDWESWKQDKTKPAKLKIIEKGGKERIVFVKPEIMERIAKYARSHLSNPDQRLWFIGYKRWHSLLKDASKKALGRAISPHKLRHGGATWLLNKGWTLQEVSEFLGHESIATTQIYAHLDKGKMLEKYAELPK